MTKIKRIGDEVDPFMLGPLSVLIIAMPNAAAAKKIKSQICHFIDPSILTDVVNPALVNHRQAIIQAYDVKSGRVDEEKVSASYDTTCTGLVEGLKEAGLKYTKETFLVQTVSMLVAAETVLAFNQKAPASIKGR